VELILSFTYFIYLFTYLFGQSISYPVSELVETLLPADSPVEGIKWK